MDTWHKFIECMMDGRSIRRYAEICEINKETAFSWRHKILDTLQIMAESVKMDRIVEGDETFFPVSYKGSRNLPRKAHKRGKQDSMRGISEDKVCVPCMVNRNGLSIAKVSNRGRVSTRDLNSVFNRRIEAGTVLCTDEMNSYREFAKRNSITLFQLKGGKIAKCIFHIQHINNYHSRLKLFMMNFKGISSKYLNNYLIWNNFVNYSKETYLEKEHILMDFIAKQNIELRNKKTRNRPAIPC